jgi:hypothetical protein
MTVKELIEKLQEYPDDFNVVDYDNHDIEDVKYTSTGMGILLEQQVCLV